MAPNLSSLPVETLSLILSQFCLHCSKEHDYDSPDGYFRCKTHEQQTDQPSWYSRDYRQTLHSVCLVSRRLSSIAQGLLYHEFVLGYGDASKSRQFSWDGRLSSFLRTIAARRDLAAQVKRIYAQPYLLRAVTEEEAKATLEGALGARAAAVPDGASSVQLFEYLAAFDEMREQRPFFSGPARHPGWQLLGMLLTLAPNLERLSLQVEGPGWVFVLKHHAEGILDAVAASKGSLSTLNLHMCGGIGQVNLNLQGLQSLRLTHSRLSDRGLLDLLDSCKTPGIKSFYYEARSPRLWTSCTMDHFGYDAHFRPIDAITGLSRHASTLTSLHLDLGTRHDLSGAHLTTLSRFPALKHVFLNATAVCNSVTADGQDYELLTGLLPPNVESLYLAGAVQDDAVRARMAKALVHLARTVKKGEQFTALKMVRCDAEMEGHGVLEVFELARVDFAYESWEGVRCAPTLGVREGTPPGRIVKSEDEDYEPLYDFDDDL